LGVATSTIAAETSSWFLGLAKLTLGVDLGVARNSTIAPRRGRGAAAWPDDGGLESELDGTRSGLESFLF
jgi:hypothetical protein